MLWSLALCSVAALAAPEGVLRVIDGDTFDVGGARVRLHAVDAPELDQTCGGAGAPVWDCGAWVRDEVRRRFDGARATCRTLDVDRYDRLVAKCTVAGRDLGAVLVGDGLAFAYRDYGWDYDLQEKAAAVAGRGLHGARVQAPAAFRRDQRAGAAQTAQIPEGCVIKGNISGKGTRIYHVPGQKDYAATRINRGKGERMFCSRAEAEAAGWRAARR